MTMLIAGLLLFVLIHLVPTVPMLRSALIARLGDGAYKGLFSLVALAGLALIVLGYDAAQRQPFSNPQVWSPPPWGRHATMALMLPVFVLLAAVYLRGNISRIARHPMVLAVKLWALAHLFVRGDLASLLLFVWLLAWAIYDRISLKRREADGLAVPAPGGPATNDAIALVLGLVVYAAFAKWLHGALIGVKLIA